MAARREDRGGGGGPIPYLTTTGRPVGRKPRSFVGKCGKAYLIKEEVTTLEEVRIIQDKVNVVDFVSGKEVPRILAVGVFPPLSLHKVESGLHSCRVLGKPDDDGEYGITKLSSAVAARTLANADSSLSLLDVSSPVHFTPKTYKSCIVSNSISNGLDTLDVKLAGYQGDLHLKLYAEFASRVERAVESLVYNFIKNCGTPFPVLVIPTTRLSDNARFGLVSVIEDKIKIVLKRWYPNTCDVTVVTMVQTTNVVPEDVIGAYHDEDQGTITTGSYHDPVSGFKMNYYLISDTCEGSISNAWKFAHALQNDINPLHVDHGAFISTFGRHANVMGNSSSGYALEVFNTGFSNASYPVHNVVGASEIRIVRAFSLSCAIKAYESIDAIGQDFIREFYVDRNPTPFQAASGVANRSTEVIDYHRRALTNFVDLNGGSEVTHCLGGESIVVDPILDKGLPVFLKSVNTLIANNECFVDSLVCGTNLFRFESNEFCGSDYKRYPTEIELAYYRAKFPKL